MVHPRGTVAGTHDLGYASSPDAGLTWYNGAGTKIATTGTPDLINIADPWLAVPVPVDHLMNNQETQAFDSAGRVHVVVSQLTTRRLTAIGGCRNITYAVRVGRAQPVHYWRDLAGQWHSAVLPYVNPGRGRTKLVFDRWDTAYLVLPDGRVVAATAQSRWTRWRLVFRDPSVLPAGELIVDRQRILADGVLSMAFIQRSSDGAGSALRVVDLRVDTRRG